MQTIPCIVLLVLVAHFTTQAAAQSRREHCVMFYNVENLFHPSEDSTVADDDFTPGGVRRWNFYRYNRKIAAVCKVILAANGWEPPDAVCLSEIENRQVLNDIIFHPLMLGQQYRILHRDSPDHRGIDVGILYRGDRMRCLDTSWIEIRNARGDLVPTREILSATFRLTTTGDTIVICANHWTSKYGGALETEEKRLLQSRLLGEHIEALLSPRMPDRLPDASTSHGSAYPCGISVIAGGDLNDLSGTAPVQMLSDTFGLEEVLPGWTSAPGTGIGNNAGPASRQRLRPSFPRMRSSSGIRSDTITASRNYGSYKYQGSWGSIDHVFVGGRLRAHDCLATVFCHPLLLEEDIKYTGKKPFRTYIGFTYHGGFSDHLPLLLHFVVPDGLKNDWERPRGVVLKEAVKHDLEED